MRPGAWILLALTALGVAAVVMALRSSGGAVVAAPTDAPGDAHDRPVGPDRPPVRVADPVSQGRGNGGAVSGAPDPDRHTTETGGEADCGLRGVVPASDAAGGGVVFVQVVVDGTIQVTPDRRTGEFEVQRLTAGGHSLFAAWMVDGGASDTAPGGVLDVAVFDVQLASGAVRDVGVLQPTEAVPGRLIVAPRDAGAGRPFTAAEIDAARLSRQKANAWFGKLAWPLPIGSAVEVRGVPASGIEFTGVDGPKTARVGAQDYVARNRQVRARLVPGVSLELPLDFDPQCALSIAAKWSAEGATKVRVHTVGNGVEADAFFAGRGAANGRLQLAPGEYLVAVFAVDRTGAARAFAARQVALAAAEQDLALDLVPVLPATGRLPANVRGPVALALAQHPTVVLWSTEAAADGAFAIDGLPRGESFVLVRDGGQPLPVAATEKNGALLLRVGG